MRPEREGQRQTPQQRSAAARHAALSARPAWSPALDVSTHWWRAFRWVRTQRAAPAEQQHKCSQAKGPTNGQTKRNGSGVSGRPRAESGGQWHRRNCTRSSHLHRACERSRPASAASSSTSMADRPLVWSVRVRLRRCHCRCCCRTRVAMDRVKAGAACARAAANARNSDMAMGG